MHDACYSNVYVKDRSECVELIVLLLYQNIVVIQYFLLENITSMCIRTRYLSSILYYYLIGGPYSTYLHSGYQCLYHLYVQCFLLCLILTSSSFKRYGQSERYLQRQEKKALDYKNVETELGFCRSPERVYFIRKYMFRVYNSENYSI